MRHFLKIDFPDLEPPHQKSELTTRIGRVVERISYTDILLLTTLVLLFCSTYFALGSHSHTLAKNGSPHEAGFLEAIYFCIVTFTSLGYGDLAPIGFGRVVASLLVFWGLATIALVIGKIASERSQTTLLLLHRSDVERRISEFTKKLATLRCNASELQINHDVSGLDDLSGVIVDVHQSMNRYLIFHANQSTALENGNEGALSALLKELANVQEICVSVHKEANKIQARRLARTTKSLTFRLLWTAKFMHEHYVKAASKSSWTEALVRKLSRRREPKRPLSTSTSRVLTRMEHNLDVLEKWRSTSITVDTLDAVYDLMPVGPKNLWPKHVNKDIARNLGTSNNRITRHVDQLVKEGALPK